MFTKNVLSKTPLVLFCVFCASSGWSQSRRLTDDQVKKLMEDVDKDVERYTDAVEPKYRTATLRSATSEVSVEAFLTDLKKHCETMKDRFKDDYAASPEVLLCLRQASVIDSRASSGGNLFGGEKEWPRLKGTVGQLAKAYGIDWAASPDTWNSRRMNDRETVKVIEGLSAYVEPFKKSLESALEHVQNVNKDERKKAFDSLDRLKDVGEDLKGAVEDGKDATGELSLLKTATQQVQSFVGKYGLQSAVGSTWGPLDAHLSRIVGAFS